VVLLLGGLWLRQESAPAGPSEAEMHQAAREARMVLHLTSRALRKTEAAAFRDVLTDEVSQALRRTPIRWPERSAAERRGS
jgi:prophage antirepressor-like protein